MKRKRRPGEVVCRCGAYRFPHRFMGGYCDGGSYVAEVWEKNQGSGCRDCILFERREAGECGADYPEEVCQALDGKEEIRECPELVTHIRYEGVRLYGVNKPPPKRMGWRR